MLDRRLLIVTGKGGVGRSAVSAAVALARAGRGERVLALALDRGAGLAAHLGCPNLTPLPVATPDGPLAAAVDPATALEEYVRRRVGSAPIAVAARVFRVLAATVPGVRDIVLLGKVAFEATRGDWDAVVVDGPPSGQVQSLFEAPEAIAEIVPRGTVRDHAAEVGAAMGDPAATGLVVVATPEELAITEAHEIGDAATRAGVSPHRTSVINRMVPAPGFTAPPPGTGARREAAQLHLEVRAAQELQVASFHPDAVLPLLFGTHRPLEVARLLAEILESP